MGTTATGKTGYAVELVQRFPLDIISVDSALVYRGMDVGTAKPEPHVLARAPHRLIDIREPTETYSAAQFREDALREIDATHARGRIPLLVGGTMLYFRALVRGLAPLPSADPAIRERLTAEAQIHGWGGLHERLQRVDPQAAARIHPNDPQRIQRALEVYELTGESLSSLQSRAIADPFPYQLESWILAPRDRHWLHERIEARFDDMLAGSFVEEVAGLRERPGLHREHPAMRAVGYRQVWDYLDGDYDYATMRTKGIIATRQFAKRQLTWLRRRRNDDWFVAEDSGLLDVLCARVEALLSRVAGERL